MEPTKAIQDGLALLVAAFRQEVDTLQKRAYQRVLKDVPADVILAGADRLCAEPGRRFFPTVPEWVGACAVVIDERRKVAARTAQAIRDGCQVCHGSGWSEAEGPNQVERCPCVKQAAALMDGLPAALKVLPASSSESEAGA